MSHAKVAKPAYPVYNTEADEGLRPLDPRRPPMPDGKGQLGDLRSHNVPAARRGPDLVNLHPARAATIRTPPTGRVKNLEPERLPTDRRVQPLVAQLPVPLPAGARHAADIASLEPASEN